jgi:phage terminase large subunit-like protein
MKITPEILESVPFQYALDVREGRAVVGRRIIQAVERFWRWVEESAGLLYEYEVPGAVLLPGVHRNFWFVPNPGHNGKDFYLDHAAGLHVLWFFSGCLNHTVGALQGKPFVLAPFQAFTMYNLFAWKKMTGSVPVRGDDFRRINSVYDKRAKKNGKTAEMAGLALYMMSYDEEAGAQVYVGATKEDQARICWGQAKSFIDSHRANPVLRRMGFRTQQKTIFFDRTESKMMPLGGDSKTQDGINTHLGIVDEYHAHSDDSVKENMESSMSMRSQPLLYHITTAGLNIQSPCKNYEDEMIEVLEQRHPNDDHIWVMIHNLDDADDWENPANWIKANPLLGQGLSIDWLMKRYNAAKISPRKVPEFKTKSLNMWVDAPTIWIESEIWKKNKHNLSKEEVWQKFAQFGGHMGVDLSMTTDITAVVMVSNADDDGDRYIVPYLFCPDLNIDKRSKNDNVPYRYWASCPEQWLIATPGDQIDYEIVEGYIKDLYWRYNILSLGADSHQFVQMGQNLMSSSITLNYVGQSIMALSAPTKEFERLARKGSLKHDGNPILGWMLAGCIIITDPNENMKIHKGRSNAAGKKRIDGIPATINAIHNGMVPEFNPDVSDYADPDVEFVC